MFFGPETHQFAPRMFYHPKNLYDLVSSNQPPSHGYIERSGICWIIESHRIQLVSRPSIRETPGRGYPGDLRLRRPGCWFCRGLVVAAVWARWQRDKIRYPRQMLVKPRETYDSLA